MSADDPFAGLKLSSQAPSQKLDQRLFEEPAPQPPPKPPPETQRPLPPSPPEALAKSSEKPPAPPKPEPLPEAVLLKPPSLRRKQFDIDEQPLFKASFLFTREELEALEDLKLELRRELDAKVTKEGLIRSALQMLLEDYAENGKKSYAYKKMRTR